MSQWLCLVRPAHLTGVEGCCCILRLDLQASIDFWWMLLLKCVGSGLCKRGGCPLTCSHPLPHTKEITGVQLLQTALGWGGGLRPFNERTKPFHKHTHSSSPLTTAPIFTPLQKKCLTSGGCRSALGAQQTYLYTANYWNVRIMNMNKTEMHVFLLCCILLHHVALFVIHFFDSQKLSKYYTQMSNNLPDQGFYVKRLYNKISHTKKIKPHKISTFSNPTIVVGPSLLCWLSKFSTRLFSLLHWYPLQLVTLIAINWNLF